MSHSFLWQGPAFVQNALDAGLWHCEKRSRAGRWMANPVLVGADGVRPQLGACHAPLLEIASLRSQ